jgi:coproporphyrinogen III oxidase-like Fe-S oxidoreductase
VSAEAAIEEAFFLGLRLNRGIDLERIWKQMRAGSEVREREGHDFSRATSAGTTVLAAEAKRSSIEIGEDAIAHWQSALEQCQADGLVEQQGTTLRLSSRGRLLSNEVFARFLAEENAEENKVGTGHVNPR